MLEASLSAALGVAACPADLDEIQRLVLMACGEGTLEEDAAERLFQAIAARRKPRSAERPLRTIAGGLAAALPGIVGSLAPAPTPATAPPAPRRWSIFSPRKPQRAPDAAEARRRSRWLAASGPMPPALASNFTTKELAVLLIVADECREKGQCDRSFDELAARAGASRATARRALRFAERLELVAVLRRPQAGKKNLTNVVTVIDPTWKAWISRSRSKSIGGQDRPLSDTDSKKGFSEGRKSAPPASSPIGRSENRARGAGGWRDQRRKKH